MKKVISGVFFLLITLGTLREMPPAVASEVVCVDRAKFVQRLAQVYEEHQISNGINYNGIVVEIFASEKGHFTILATQPDGVSCVIASGDNWQEKPLLKAELGI